MDFNDGTHPECDEGKFCEFLGIRVHFLDIPKLNRLAVQAAADDQKMVIGNHNLHSLYVFHKDSRMRSFHDRVVKRTHVDGMGIILLGRLLGHPLGREHRVTYADWMRPLLKEASALGWRVFFVGLRAITCRRSIDIVHQMAPGVEFRVAHWDLSETVERDLNEKVLKQINLFRPQILLVGLGMPHQEAWIADNYDRIRANVILPCGAAMDYMVGVVPTPPRWAGHYGVEWIFRLVRQPRHLWRRYLIEPWYLLRLFCLEIIRGRPSVRSGASVKDSL